MPHDQEEAGSLSPLIIFYFTIILIFIFLISNIASTYVARRDLTNRAEMALQAAAQELDEFRYYYSAPLTDFLANEAIISRQFRLPIDCTDAKETFLRALHSMGSSASLQSPDQLDSPKQGINSGSASAVVVRQFRCDGYELEAEITEVHELPFQLRAFGLTHFENEISIATASFISSVNAE